MTDEEMSRRFDSLTELIVGVKESLEREMSEVKASLERDIASLHEKFDRQDARLSRHGGMLAGGSRQIARLVEWTENTDDRLAQRDKRLADLENRVQKIENERNGKRDTK